MKHKLESRLLREISIITSDMKMTPNGRKQSPLIKMKEVSEKADL